MINLLQVIAKTQKAIILNPKMNQRKKKHSNIYVIDADSSATVENNDSLSQPLNDSQDNWTVVTKKTK